MEISNAKFSMVILWCFMGVTIPHSFWTFGPGFNTEEWIIAIGFTAILVCVLSLAAYRIMNSIEKKLKNV